MLLLPSLLAIAARLSALYGYLRTHREQASGKMWGAPSLKLNSEDYFCKAEHSKSELLSSHFYGVQLGSNGEKLSPAPVEEI